MMPRMYRRRNGDVSPRTPVEPMNKAVSHNGDTVILFGMDHGGPPGSSLLVEIVIGNREPFLDHRKKQLSAKHSRAVDELRHLSTKTSSTVITKRVFAGDWQANTIESPNPLS